MEQNEDATPAAAQEDPWDNDDDIEAVQGALVRLEGRASQRSTQEAGPEAWTVAEEFLGRVRYEHVESVLRRTSMPGQENAMVWEYLQGADTDEQKCTRATEVLERLAGRTEDIAVAQMMALRFIDMKGLWRSHGDASVTSTWDLVRKTVELRHGYGGMALGMAAFSRRLGLVENIEANWGVGWFARVPDEMKHKSWLVAEDMPEATLLQIVRVAKRGATLGEAVESWKKSMDERMDYGIRRERNITAPTTPNLLSSDVAKKADGRRSTMGTRGEAMRSQGYEGKIGGSLQLRLVREDEVTGKAQQPILRGASPGKKRRRSNGRQGQTRSGNAGGGQQLRLDDGDDVAGEWQLTQNGRHKTRRQGYTLVSRDTKGEDIPALDRRAQRNPVIIADSEDEEDVNEMDLDEGEANGGSDKSNDEEEMLEATWTNGMCEAPSLMETFVKLNEIIGEMLPANGEWMEVSRKCCGVCKPIVDRAMADWKRDFVPLLSFMKSKSRVHERRQIQV